MRATWYVTEDGTAVDPSECSADDKGNVLTHKDGGVVAMRAPGVPMSRSVEVVEVADVQTSFAGSGGGRGAPALAADMQPEHRPSRPKRRPAAGYKTRGN